MLNANIILFLLLDDPKKNLKLNGSEQKKKNPSKILTQQTFAQSRKKSPLLSIVDIGIGAHLLFWLQPFSNRV